MVPFPALFLFIYVIFCLKYWYNIHPWWRADTPAAALVSPAATCAGKNTFLLMDFSVLNQGQIRIRIRYNYSGSGSGLSKKVPYPDQQHCQCAPNADRARPSLFSCVVWIISASANNLGSSPDNKRMDLKEWFLLRATIRYRYLS